MQNTTVLTPRWQVINTRGWLLVDTFPSKVDAEVYASMLNRLWEARVGNQYVVVSAR